MRPTIHTQLFLRQWKKVYSLRAHYACKAEWANRACQDRRDENRDFGSDMEGPKEPDAEDRGRQRGMSGRLGKAAGA